jgi:hypothetical protein
MSCLIGHSTLDAAVNAEALLALLRGRELQLHRPEVRCNPDELCRLLHPEFREFARSGRIYGRADVIAEFSTAPQEFDVRADGFNLLCISDTVALLTYRSAHVTAGNRLERHAIRASLWQLTESGWQLVFHQGTPIDEGQQNAT